jgi:hypothetical protein
MAAGQREYTANTGATNGNGTTSDGDPQIRTDDFDFEKLYAYFDRSSKSINDFVNEYQTTSNYNYYHHFNNRLDYRYKLMDLYDYCMLDLHLTSIVDSLFHQIIGERYSIRDSEGNVNEAATKLIKKSWFPKYIRGVLESKLYGYSLIELGDLNKKTGTLEEVRFIERRNVAPLDSLVLEYMYDTSGWDITSDEYKEDYVLVDGDEGLGWLIKALPIVMSKRFALSSHTQYAETYGTPMIVGKTTDDSYEEKKYLANEIAEARDTRVIVTGLEDDITFLNQISNDTNKIYTELVRLTNDELTMLILGQSATTESQAYAGSAEIQYRVMVDRVEAIREFVQNNVNEDLIWRLQEKGMDIPEGSTFEYSNVLEMSPESKKDLFQVLLGSYEISAEEIESTFGVTVGRQILEESNDQLLTYGEETVKERGNPDEQISKDPEQAAKDKKDAQKAQDSVLAEINFFDTVAGCDFDDNASYMDKSLRKLDSNELSSVNIVNNIVSMYGSYHTHEIDIVAALTDDIEKFSSILNSFLPRIYAGDSTAVEDAYEEMTAVQYSILSQIFTEEYGYSLEALSQDSSSEGYKNAVSGFFASFSASKQYQLLKIISDLAAKYRVNGMGYGLFVEEANKANILFNKTWHEVEGHAMQVGYNFAKGWREDSNYESIFQYKTQGDANVRDTHYALEGIKLRKSDWAKTNFTPPWEYGCRCSLFDIGSTNGQLLTKSRSLPPADDVPKEFRTNVGESGAVFSKYHPYYEGLTQADATKIRRVISKTNK